MRAEAQQPVSTRYLWLELICLFGGLPLFILFYKKRWVMVSLLWCSGLLCYRVLKRDPQFSHKTEWNLPGAKAHLRGVLLRFAVLAPLMALFTWLLDADKLFNFPRERPVLWAMVMLLYPLLSVWPQEIIFRSYLYRRYARLWKTPLHYVAASALAFGFVHIIFLNWVALSFTLAGGALFGRTYLQSRSLALVWLEHALYGCFIFTIGLGWYFFGAAWGKP